METAFNWSMLIGGLAFFFFGLSKAREGLQLSAGDRLRAILGHLIGNRFRGFFIGSLITIILQSSSATSVMLVSFASAGLISLQSAIAVMLGADIGTTLVVILLSIKKITEYSLVITAFGFLLSAWANQRKARYVGLVILGFGLVFYGMNLMSDAAIPLKNSEIASKVFVYLSDNPLTMLMLSTLFTAVIQTSAATIGIAIALSFAGLIDLQGAAPIVLGANVGTCMTAIIGCIGMGYDGKRVALAHTLSKILGVVMFYPLMPSAIKLVEFIHPYIIGEFLHIQAGVAGEIAIFHLLFNIALAIVFLPVISGLEKIVLYIIPQRESEEKFGPKYLDETALTTPSIAFAHVKREILRMAEITHDLLDKSLLMFSKGEDALTRIEELESEEDKIDILEKAIKFYLAKISQENLSEDNAKAQISLLSITSDLEDIGDIISRELSVLARKKSSWHRIFSQEGWTDLRGFQRKVEDNFDSVLLLLVSPSDEILNKIRRHENEMNEEEQHLRQSHLNRLHQGLQETFDTSSIHLDILANLRRINTKLAQIAENCKAI